MRNTFLLFITVLLSFGCAEKNYVDLIVHNGNIITVDDNFSTQEAMAIQNGIIVEIGPEHQILNKYSAIEMLDLQRRPVYPGFIDAHCHFLGFSKYNALLNLNGVRSEDELIERLTAYIESNDVPWIVGRGWDQNLWENKTYPNKEKLDALFPEKFIVLKRVDGHAALVNQKVLDMSGINANKDIPGGEVEVLDGKCTGILIDNAVDLVTKLIPEPTHEELKKLLSEAEKLCFEKGITTVSDAGLDLNDVELLEGLIQDGSLKIKLYAMLNPSVENFKKYLPLGPQSSPNLNISSFKFYADGALGSRGACLLKAYSDRPEHFGFMLTSIDSLRSYAQQVYNAGFQMNTHAIGDSANRIMLKIYGELLKTTNDRRWRIEHAQVVHSNDLKYFQDFTILPSVQPTHATSDMPWAESRLGPERIKQAYAYQDLKKQNGMIALGTDFPVEAIDPLLTLLAATQRVNLNGLPEGEFQSDQKLSYEDAIRGMTIWAAIANFEETEKGSLEVGKKADFILLNQDLKELTHTNFSEFKVLSTYINGVKVY